ncbi:colicin E3/pyocin S6 family cytotoxin [Tumidithrix elongata RA019]|uniref:Colicin E3/pyocin S6 family cytotoxin n=1 Tax=Tumidithrix elongata BACA0141 TaxID=2716417 RepID=A0AAW9Q4H7_9CYAN|nr:colicin E3/pyocin S6 family cytotoxin [Tumidithrix elongata RA019]
MSHIPPPSVLKAFPETHLVKSKTFIQGTRKLRRRWQEANGSIYEWDYRHGTVEKYDKSGRHLREYHPETGILLKPADPNRKVEP